MSDILHKEITDVILKSYYEVYNELGYGFLEKVYQNSMFIELKNRGLQVEAQKKIQVTYKGVKVGEYIADLVINNKVIVELKAAEMLLKENELQLLNYLKATEIEVGLLLNFGTKPEFRRKLFTNDIKE
jgi:GxxExxY protein